jgi:sec-independent protein translocase protein TatA
MPGPTEIILIVILILVLFGASAIPKFARSLGKAKSEFERGVKEGGEEDSGENSKNKVSGKTKK